MKIQLTNTKDVHLDGVKAIVYGESGAGKTRLCATAPTPLIISSEKGLLSIADYDIPVFEVENTKQLMEAYYAVQDMNIETICLDSFTEIAETVLAEAKEQVKDPRKAYGMLLEEITKIARAFRDLKGLNVVMTCKMGRVQDGTGLMLFGPSFPGAKLDQAVPYFFDEVLAVRVGVDDETQEPFRYVQTQLDPQYIAKDRSGKLDQYDRPDLTFLFNKITGVQNG